MATKWPETVPVFEARDICREYYGHAPGPHCAVGWLCEVFNGTPGSPLKKQPLQCRMAMRTLHNLIGEKGITIWNDDSPKAEVADALNETMRRLGYDQIFEVE